jgi:hypothetical protein
VLEHPDDIGKVIGAVPYERSESGFEPITTHHFIFSDSVRASR